MSELGTATLEPRVEIAVIVQHPECSGGYPEILDARID